MALLRPGAQLADIAQHQNLAARETGEDVGRGSHGSGVGVVSVINDAHAARRELRDSAAFDRLYVVEPGDDACQRYIERVGSSGRGQCIGNIVGAEQVQLHRRGAVRGV